MLAAAAPAFAQVDPSEQEPLLNQRDYRMQAVNPVPQLLNNTAGAMENPGGAYAQHPVPPNIAYPRVAPGQIVKQPYAGYPTANSPAVNAPAQRPLVYGYPVQKAPVREAQRAQPAPAPFAPVIIEADPLKTRTGLEFGGQLGYYHYQERDLQDAAGNDNSVREDGLKYGLTAAFTGSLYGDWFAKAEGRFALGDLTYEGWLSDGSPLVINDIPNYIAEARGFIGHDFMFGDFAVSPMVGIGYRYLFDNAHDSSQFGYGRASQYVFLPIALNPRVKLGNGDVISGLIEYDHLIWGNQKSYLNDVPAPPGFIYRDISNDQHEGYGIRGELNYKRQRWTFGPYVNYWNINQSDVEAGAYEPHNQTMEVGVQFKYRLWQPGDNFWPGSLGR